MSLNLPVDLQGQDKGKRLGDIQQLANAISEMSGLETQNGITASTTQTQAGGAIVKRVCIRVTRVINNNDAITLGFNALAGRMFTIINDGANTLQLFPKSGDKINDALTDAAVTIAANTISEYFCPVYGLWFGGATTLET